MIDYPFVKLVFTKHSKHLQDVVTSIETLVDSYDRQLESLRKLDQMKYRWRVKELEEKKSEAFKKLGHICPMIEKMTEQMNEVQTLFLQESTLNS